MWNDHFDFGCYNKLTDRGLPVPYQEVTDNIMVQRTRDPATQFNVHQSKGNDLTTRDRSNKLRPQSRYGQAVLLNTRAEIIKDRINSDAERYLARLNTMEKIGFVQPLKIIQSWPGTTTSYDMLDVRTLSTSGRNYS